MASQLSGTLLLNSQAMISQAPPPEHLLCR